MDELLRYAPVVINVISLLVSGISAGVATASVVESMLYEPPRYEPNVQSRPRSRHTSVTKRHSGGDYRVILTRNPFCSWCEEITTEELASETEGGASGPLATLEGAELVATMVSRSPEHSLAVITITRKYQDEDGNDQEYQKPVIVGIGDAIGDAVVRDIEDKRVIFEQAGQEKELSLISAGDEGKTKGHSRKSPEVRSRKKRGRGGDLLSQLGESIRKIGPNKYEIERSAVDKFMTNMAVAARGVKMMPDAGGGFRFRSVRPYSIFYKLGLRSGDVVKAVNNVDLNSVAQALALYTKFKSASHLTISLVRHGKPITLDYTIR